MCTSLCVYLRTVYSSGGLGPWSRWMGGRYFGGPWNKQSYLLTYLCFMTLDTHTHTRTQYIANFKRRGGGHLVRIYDINKRLHSSLHCIYNLMNVLTFYVNTTCWTSNSRFIFVSLNIHSFMTSVTSNICRIFLSLLPFKPLLSFKYILFNTTNNCMLNMFPCLGYRCLCIWSDSNQANVSNN